MAPMKPPTLYIYRKPYFLEAPSIATNFLAKEEEEPLHTSTKSKEE
jgi:hypothetical protein